MFTGIQSYSTRPFPREMGESPAEYAKACERYEQRNRPQGRPFPREMGESPEEYAKACDEYMRRQAENPAPKPTYKEPYYKDTDYYKQTGRPFPREMGETHEEYAKACDEYMKRQDEARGKRGSEMTEQERRLDMYA